MPKPTSNVRPGYGHPSSCSSSTASSSTSSAPTASKPINPSTTEPSLRLRPTMSSLNVNSNANTNTSRSMIPIPVTASKGSQSLTRAGGGMEGTITGVTTGRTTKALPRPTGWFNSNNNPSSSMTQSKPNLKPVPATTRQPHASTSNSKLHSNATVPMLNRDRSTGKANLIPPMPKQTRLDDSEDEDFIMVSVSPTVGVVPRMRVGGGTHPPPQHQMENSPTDQRSSCAVSMAAQRLSLMETDDSPERMGISPTASAHIGRSGSGSGSASASASNSPVKTLLGQSRSLGLGMGMGEGISMGKAMLGARTSSGVEGSSPDSVRQRQGSWIKRSKVSSFSGVGGGAGGGNVEDGVMGLNHKRSIGSFSFSPMTPGVRGPSVDPALFEEDEILAGSSSPPPPDTPVQRSAGFAAAARLGEFRRGSLGNGIAQPRFGTLKTSQSIDDHRTAGLFSPCPAGRDGGAGSGAPHRFSNSKSLKGDAGFFGGTPARPMLGHSKKTISLDGQSGARLASLAGGGGNGIGNKENDSPFGSGFGIPPRARKMGSGSTASPYPHGGKPHRRTGSSEQNMVASISRSHGLKCGLSDSVNSNSSTGSTKSGTIPKSISGSSRSSFESQPSVLTPDELHIFDDVKPLQAAFEPAEGPVERKFKPGRDSALSFDRPGFEPPANENGFVMPGSAFGGPRGFKPVRPAFLKRASSLGDERSPAVTPGLDAMTGSGWPSAFGFDLPVRMSLGAGAGSKPTMPDTPVKRPSFGATSASTSTSSEGSRIGQSASQPSLPTGSLFSAIKPSRTNIDTSSLPPPPPMPTFVTTGPALYGMTSHLASSQGKIQPVHLTVTTASSPVSPAESMEMEEASPTMRFFSAFRASNGAEVAGPSMMAEIAPQPAFSVRKGLLRRLSSGVASTSSESDDGTPTRPGSYGHQMLAPKSIPRVPTPTPGSPQLHVPMLTDALPTATPFQASKHVSNAFQAGPRHSLPNFTLSKPLRRHAARQSAPEAPEMAHEDDIFESRYVVLESLGKGAFSQVVKVKEREGDRVFAVKKARGVFEGLKDRLRHLEEVDILRHLASRPHPNVIAYTDAWEQNRQLFIVTELCLANLAHFLEEYGRIVERLDEARVWKIARELADGLHHIHSMGVIHFDIKPANILIDEHGTLKIGDFGHATRWPRVDAAAILEGSGLGGHVGSAAASDRMPDREGDRVYMAPEELSGQFSMAADIFSYGLVVLEASTNICVPDGGPSWHALRENDFSIIDFTGLSPALIDLITSCMRASPELRPSTDNIVQHPIITRARATGRAALTPEDGVNGETWLASLLGGSPARLGGAAGFAQSSGGHRSQPLTPTSRQGSDAMAGMSPDMLGARIETDGDVEMEDASS